MSPCDNCRIKSAHYCVTAFRGGPARYYGRSAGPRNGGPTRRCRRRPLPKDSSLFSSCFFVYYSSCRLVVSELMGWTSRAQKRRKREQATAFLSSFSNMTNREWLSRFFSFNVIAAFYLLDVRAFLSARRFSLSLTLPFLLVRFFSPTDNFSFLSAVAFPIRAKGRAE